MSKKILTGIALGLSLTACGPSQEEIKQMIDEVPLNKRHSLVLDYDTKLLHNIDSLVDAGKNMESAIKKGHDITWDQACENMPEKSEWKGEEYIVRNEAEKQLEKSRETKTRTTMTPMPVYNGKTTVVRIRPVVTTYYEYHPEYRDSLAREVKNKENTKLDLFEIVKRQKMNN